MRKHSDLLSIHDSSYTHSQSHGGNLREVVTKETRIGHNGVFGQSFYSGPGHEAGAWLIEGDVAIRADTYRETVRKNWRSLNEINRDAE